MKTEQPLFTIFTGTYNSTKVIHRLFQSVSSQTYRNFEWIIFDDCSKDNTVELIRRFQKELNDIEIKLFVNEQNRGVSYGRWEALKMARGRYFVTWDHDDIQMPDQLEAYVEIWDKYDSEDIGAICACLIDEHGNKIGRKFPNHVTVSDYFSMYSQFLMGENKPGKSNERHLCNKTEKFRQAIEFIQEEGIVSLPELPNGSEVWGMMAVLGSKTIYLDKIVRQYFVEPDRPSMTTVSRSKGAKRIYRDRKVWVNYFIKMLPAKDWKIKLRTYLSFCLYGSYCNLGFGKILSDAKGFFNKAMVTIFFIPGLVLKRKLEAGSSG
jgi:glycosyltransferase involved in cell wall biosynthesis